LAKRAGRLKKLKYSIPLPPSPRGNLKTLNFRVLILTKLELNSPAL
jgi:hypothetical protein